MSHHAMSPVSKLGESPPVPPPIAAPSLSIPAGVKFAIGGLSGMGATMVVHPLEVVKNRMQVSVKADGSALYKSSLHAIRSIVTSEGVLAVYDGLSAGLLRQATYATTRLGIYTALFEKYSGPDNKGPSLLVKFAIGSVAGGVGSFVGTPTEVAMVRMTTDGRLPPAERRGYTHVFNALYRITKEEGVLALWKGSAPTVGRAVVSNAAQLATYSQAKEMILTTNYVRDGIPCHLLASMVSGLAASASSLPLDMAKTRIQNMHMVDGKPEFSGILDVLGKVIKREGFFSLWRGFTPYYLKMGPHTILTFILLEQLNHLYYTRVLGVQGGHRSL